ncbi:unnamed protein product [Ectocarpus sp. 6 AP-2014]
MQPRNIEGPQRSEEGGERTQWLKLGGWTVLGLAVFWALCVVSWWTVRDIPGAWVGESSRSAVMKEKLRQRRDSPSISSAKLVSVAGEAAAGLEMWTSLGGGENVAVVGAGLVAEFQELQYDMGVLQESLAKSRSVGSVVGLVSWDLNKAQALLKEDQAVLVEQGRQVHALARGVLQEHQEYQSSRDDVRADGEGRSKRQAGEELELMNKLTYGLGEANVQEILGRLQEVESEVNAAVATQEAEEMAARYAAAAGATREQRGGGGRGGRPAEVSDEDIARVVEEVVLSVDTPSSPDSCVTVELARNLTRAELERFGADRTGIPDYAMGPAGAHVISRMTSETYEPPMGALEWFRSKRRGASLQAVSPPPVAINPESRLGRCWPMKGSDGRLTVKLARTIKVESISLEHAPREVLLNKGISAPKDFTVVGYPKGRVVRDDDPGDVLVSGGEYRLEGDVIQFFEVAEEYRQVDYGVIALVVDSNHGEGAYTCIYRLRVHGTPSP